MLLVKDNDIVCALSPDRVDHLFSKRVLPGGLAIVCRYNIRSNALRADLPPLLNDMKTDLGLRGQVDKIKKKDHNV